MVKVVLGGTFEHLHAGHSRLIEEAFLLLKEEGGGFVHIGLTSDEMAGGKAHVVSGYSTRKKELDIFISNLIQKLSLPSDCYFISKLNDPFGPAASEEYNYIIVSPETLAGAEKINKIRLSNNLPELKIRLVSFVLAEDTIPISSTRIDKGEIDREGRIQKKIQK